MTKKEIRALRAEIIGFPAGSGYEKFKVIPLQLLVKAPWNYKQENDKTSAKLKANLERNGQVENLIARELGDGTFEIANGNHRLDELTDLGRQNAIVYDLGKVSAEEAQRIAIETNETRFDTDHVQLAKLMKSLEEEFTSTELSGTMPFDEQQIESMKKMLDFDLDEIGKGPDNNGSSEGEEPRKNLKLYIPEETYNLWQKWLERCKETLGIESPERCFELAVVEAMNIPEASLSA